MKNKIPHILHQVWFPIHFTSPPEKYRKGTESFLDKHPGWKYMFWDQTSARSFLGSNYRWFLPVFISYNHWIKQVDSLRYFILHYFGGVYLDMDSECIKNIENMLESSGFIGCSNYRLPGEVGNGFLASIPGHPLLKKIIDDLPNTKKKFVFDATGPAFLGRHIREFDNCTGDVRIFPPRFAYPIDALGNWRVKRDHADIHIWNYMDGLWSKPVPGKKAWRLMKRISHNIEAMFLKLKGWLS